MAGNAGWGCGIYTQMLYWAAVFLIIAIIAALFGFGLVTAAAIGIAKVLFVIFLILFIISVFAHVARRRT